MFRIIFVKSKIKWVVRRMLTINLVLTFILPPLLQQSRKETLLIKAAREGKEDVVILLLDIGAAIEATDTVS